MPPAATGGTVVSQSIWLEAVLQLFEINHQRFGLEALLLEEAD